MLFQHCLTLSELELLVKIEFEEYNIPDDEALLQALFESWNDWVINFICLNYLLLRMLERQQKTNQDILNILKSLYDLPNSRGLGLDFDEMDDSFVEYMLGFSRDESISLEDNLIEIRQELSEYRY